MTGLIARLPLARTILLVALSMLMFAFSTNASSAQRHAPQRVAHGQPHAKKVVKKAVKKSPRSVSRRPSSTAARV